MNRADPKLLSIEKPYRREWNALSVVYATVVVVLLLSQIAKPLLDDAAKE